MENCPSNETKSGNPCFELNNEKYNSMACFYTAKINESPFFLKERRISKPKTSKIIISKIS